MTANWSTRIKVMAGVCLAVASFAASLVSVLQYLEGRHKKDTRPQMSAVLPFQVPTPPPSIQASIESKTPAVSGEWKLITITRSATLARYKDLSVEYDILLHSTSEGVVGSGTKRAEGSRSLVGDQQISLDEIRASISSGNVLLLSWTERGQKRLTRGRSRFSLSSADTLRGTFRHDAANAQGDALLIRVQ